MRQTSALFLLLALLSCSPTGSEIEVRVVSTRPHLVSGGDALIEAVASGMDLQLTVNGENRVVEFAAAEKKRLETIFDQGVCDWSRPGVHQAVNQTWLSYGPSPVNRYEP